MITEQHKQTQAEAVLEMLSMITRATSREMSRYFERDQYMIARRLSDLKNEGRVKVAGYRKCAVTKEMCKTWALK
jgi:predicted HTH transcriptional regulator